jgi:hypothetical protein
MNKITKKDKEFVLNIEQEVNSCIKNSSNIKLYTEEDLRKVIEMARNGKRKATDTKGAEYLFSLKEDEIIQSLQQPKLPVAFDCKVERYTVGEMSSLPLGTVNQRLKTTTNSQGITQWVGSYIYE